MMKRMLSFVVCLALLAGNAAAQSADEQRQRTESMKRELEWAAILIAAARAADQQGGGRGAVFDPNAIDPTSGPVVAGAPFSADATTTVTQVLGDGTRIDQRATAKFYRDGTGRIRREQTIVGMDWANPQAPEPMTVITIDSEPGDRTPYQLDPVARTARRVSRAASPMGLRTVRWNANTTTGKTQIFFQGNGRELSAVVDMPVTFQGLSIPQRGIPGDLRPTEEQLPARQIEGLRATGLRTTVSIPTGRVGNDRPIQITDERWQSPDLGVVVYSRFSDPRTGLVEYRLTNINRSEPAASLFTVPADYTILGGGGGGQRSGGGGRGGAK